METDLEKEQEKKGEALYTLGMFYLRNGLNIRKAVCYFEQASQMNHLPSKFQLSFSYGDDVKKSFLLRKDLVEKNYEPSIIFLANMYQSGVGMDIAADKKKADELFTKGFDDVKSMNNPHVQLRLAYCYERGLGGIIQNKTKAFEIYERLCNQKENDQFPWFMCYYGLCFERGNGCTKDTQKAFTLYQKAAEKGCFLILLWMASSYRDGSGLIKDAMKAFDLCIELNRITEAKLIMSENIDLFFSSYVLIEEKIKMLEKDVLTLEEELYSPGNKGYVRAKLSYESLASSSSSSSSASSSTKS